MLAGGDRTGWLGWEDSNSEMSLYKRLGRTPWFFRITETGLAGWGGRIRNFAFRNQTRSVPLRMASRRAANAAGGAAHELADPGSSALPQAMGFDTIIRNAKFRILPPQPSSPVSTGALAWNRPNRATLRHFAGITESPCREFGLGSAMQALSRPSHHERGMPAHGIVAGNVGGIGVDDGAPAER
jgi:hypothetical protein